MLSSRHFYNMKFWRTTLIQTKGKKRSNRLHQTNAPLFSFGSAAETRLWCWLLCWLRAHWPALCQSRCHSRRPPPFPFCKSRVSHILSILISYKCMLMTNISPCCAFSMRKNKSSTTIATYSSAWNKQTRRLAPGCGRGISPDCRPMWLYNIIFSYNVRKQIQAILKMFSSFWIFF